MKILFYFSCLALSVAFEAGAQDTSGRPRVRVQGDQNTSVRTSTQTNVPRANRPVRQSPYRPTDPLSGDDKPDVLLDIPTVSVDEITLDVQNLQAHLALDARVASLVTLTAGVDVSIEKVNLTIKGVDASVLLIVRLENVRAIIEKTLNTLENNPQILDRLLSTVDNTVNTVGGVANTALQPGGVISQTVNSLGQTVTRTVDAAGNIVEKTLDNTGGVLNSQTVGKLLELPLVKETTNAAGQTLRQVRDTSGAVIELTLDKAGKVVSSKLISGSSSNKR
jgi:hypothetical protein